MATLRHKVTRTDHITRSGDDRNVVRGHALFVRFMERKGLGDCIRYFPDSMTLGNLRSATQHELMTKYDIYDVKDRERIMRIVDESHREDQSDAESDYSSSPKQSSSMMPVNVTTVTAITTAGPSTLSAADETVVRRSSAASNNRLLQRTLSETVRHRRPDRIQSIGNQGSLVSTKHLSSSQFGLNVSWNTQQPSDGSNLLRMRNSLLGKSEPLLSTSIRDVTMCGCSSTPASRRPSGRVSSCRRSLVLPQSVAMSLNLPLQSATSHLLGSPLDSPRSASSAPSHSQFQFISKSVIDSRRWSVASLASSGCTSNVSSQYSSQERLQHAMPSTPDQCPSTPLLTTKHRRQHHFSSNESNTTPTTTTTTTPAENDGSSGEGQGSSSGNSSGLRSPLLRPRSQSLSSPARSPGMDSGTMLMNNVYRERFPKAVEQMEERLSQFLDSNQLEELVTLESDGATRFVHHQVVELARDCLTKSRSKLISSSYFYELSENLERLLRDAQLRSASSLEHLTQLIKKLLMIVSRPARLLECLEFDPEEFYRLLEAAEGQAKQTFIKMDIPRYIIGKLGLNRDRDMFVDLADMSSVDSGRDTPDTDESSEGPCGTLSENKDSKLVPATKRQPCQDDFETIKLISNGAYGAVYLVRHKESLKTFAMKKLLKNNLVLRNQVDQVFAERDILTFTDNPFVVSFFCSFETKKHLCMVLEYVEGGDCGTLLKNIGGPLSFDLARMYLAETVLALEYLHSYGIVHRDLKPDNLLITLMGHIKLTDFGLSKVGLMNLTTNLYEGAIDKDCTQFKDMQVFGTPEYIAPEVILRQGYGKPVDWWALGVILFEFLIGCVPFYGNTPEELFYQIINAEVEWPDEDEFCPPDDAKDLILGLLQKNPLDRLGTIGVHQIKEHILFDGLDWDSLLRQKAEFVPHLEHEEDTSYFDTRADRYNHEADDTEDDCEDIMFNSFSSCSPRYMKIDRERTNSQLIETPESSNSQSNIVDNWINSFSEVSTMSGHSDVATTGADYVDIDSATSDVTIQSSVDTVDTVVVLPITTISHNSVTSSTTVSQSLTVADVASTSRLSPVESHSSPSRSGSVSLSRVTDMCHSTSLTINVTTATTNNDSSVVPAVVTTSSGAINIPKFSLSVDDSDSSVKDVVDVATAVSEEREKEDLDTLSPLRPLAPSKSAPSMPAVARECRDKLSNIVTLHGLADKPVQKSASASQLVLSVQTATTSSDANTATIVHSPVRPYSPVTPVPISQRDISPPADRVLPGTGFLKPSVIIRRGPRGYGFTLRAIRVYCGDSEYYTLHHLVVAVERNSPAMDAGLCAGDLITHVNGISVQGLLHIELVRLILTGGASVSLCTVPLANTSIRIGARKSPVVMGLVAEYLPCGGGPGSGARVNRRQQKDDRRRRSSLFRQLSSRKAAEQQLNVTSSPMSPNRRSLSSADSLPGSPTTATSCPRLHNIAVACDPLCTTDSAHSSSQSSSPSSSAPGSPAVTGVPAAGIPGSAMAAGGRPSTLHGLKHKLSVTRAAACNRRKSWHNNPLSPLVRTPSPSPANSNTGATSPTRSPSPLTTAVHHRHHTSTSGQPLIAAHVPGISNMAQLYSPAQSQTTSAAVPSQLRKVSAVQLTEHGRHNSSPDCQGHHGHQTLSPDRTVDYRQHTAPSPERRQTQSELHRRSMSGHIERRLGLQQQSLYSSQHQQSLYSSQQQQSLYSSQHQQSLYSSQQQQSLYSSQHQQSLYSSQHQQSLYPSSCDYQLQQDGGNPGYYRQTSDNTQRHTDEFTQHKECCLERRSESLRERRIETSQRNYRHSEPLRVDVNYPATGGVMYPVTAKSPPGGGESLTASGVVKRMSRSDADTSCNDCVECLMHSTVQRGVRDVDDMCAGGDCVCTLPSTYSSAPSVKHTPCTVYLTQVKSGIVQVDTPRPAVITVVPVDVKTGITTTASIPVELKSGLIQVDSPRPAIISPVAVTIRTGTVPEQVTHQVSSRELTRRK